MVTEAWGNIANPSFKYIAQGLTASGAMKVGVSKKIDEIHDIHDEVKRRLEANEAIYGCISIPSIIRIKSSKTGTVILNIINKKSPKDKLTYETLFEGLRMLAEFANNENIPYLYLPKIGCGHDKLDWDIVKAEIEKIFKDSKTEIILLEY